MHYVENVTRERIKAVIEQNNRDNFIYCELMPYNQAFIDKILSAQSIDELVDIWRDMSRESFLNWYVKPDRPEEAEAQFIAINNVDKQKKTLMDLLDKNQLYVHLSEIEDELFNVSELDKALNRDFLRGRR